MATLTKIFTALTGNRSESKENDFSSINNCHLCQLSFNFGLRRNKCSICSTFMCENCSNNQFAVETPGVYQRICDDCLCSLQISEEKQKIPKPTIKRTDFDVNGYYLIPICVTFRGMSKGDGLDKVLHFFRFQKQDSKQHRYYIHSTITCGHKELCKNPRVLLAAEVFYG